MLANSSIATENINDMSILENSDIRTTAPLYETTSSVYGHLLSQRPGTHRVIATAVETAVLALKIEEHMKEHHCYSYLTPPEMRQIELYYETMRQQRQEQEPESLAA